MARYVFTAMANSKPGSEIEYKEWCKNQHVNDVLDIPGFVSAQRFQLADVPFNEKSGKWTFLTIYEIETDDPNQVLAELGRRLGTEKMPRSEHSGSAVTFLWKPL